VTGSFQAPGTEYPEPIYEELNGAVNHDDLKLLKLLDLANSPGRHFPSDPNENG